MHPLVLYDIVRLEQARTLREIEAHAQLRAASRGLVGRPRRRLSMRLQGWLQLRPARAGTA
jgi:hypothetical protein